MADFSMSDMPWLGQPADPAGSLLRGVQAGSAISSARTQRGALAQRKMEFEQEQSMREREWREKMAVLPLEMTLKHQEGQINKFKIEELLTARQDRIGNESALMELNKHVARSFTEADGPETAQQMLFESLIKNPRLIADPRFKELRAMVDTSMAAKEQLIRLKNERAGIEGLGNVTVVTNPTDKTTATFVRTGPNSITAFPKIDDPNAPQTTLGKLFADRNTAFKAGKLEEANAFDKVIALEQTSKGFSLTTNPDGTVVATYGGAKGDVPSAMVTKAESAMAGAVNAIKLGSTLINRLRPEDIGILGRGGEIIMDEGLAQVIPGAANLKRVNSRTLLKFFRADFIKALREGDSQMSDRDRREVEAMLPSDKANESLPSALEKIKAATKEAAERSRFGAQRANRPLPNELLKPAELIERVKKGEITWQQATDIAKTSPFRDEFDNFVETK